MDAALIGLTGTTIGALSGFGGAWLAQRGQIRLFREQRSYDAEVRWADDKRALYRDLLVAMYKWYDALVSIRKGEDDAELVESRTNAITLVVEVSLIAADPVRTAVEEAHRTFFHTQPHIFERSDTREGQPSEPVEDVLEGVRTKLLAMETEMRRELVTLR